MLRPMAGFTLIEAMITVTVAAILATIALPSYTTFVANQRVKSVGSDLMVTMIKARNEAVMRNANVTVSSNAGNWQNGWLTTDNNGAILDTHGAVPQAVAIGTNFTGTGSSVIYQSSGRLHPTLTGVASFTITSSKSASAYQCVTTDLSGRPNSKATMPCP
jgi:type IV fimbrial biogenesis protein FimT